MVGPAVPTGQAPVLVSVIVPVRNAAGTLSETLDAVERQTLPQECYELLVVDDRSTDESRSLVRANDLARLVEMPRRGGSYAARNLGLDHARGEVIAFTDADCRPASDWLQEGLSDLDAQAAELLGGYIEVPLGPRPSITELLDVCWHFDQAHTLQLGFVANANLFARRAVFDRVGRFDGDLHSHGDREFCRRATAHGFKLAYSPRAVIVHPPRTRARQAVAKAFRLGVGRAQTDISPGRFGSRRADRPRSLSRTPQALTGKVRDLIAGPEVFGVHRVRSQGYEPSRSQLILIQLGAYLLIDLPQMAGYLVGRIRARRTPHPS